MNSEFQLPSGLLEFIKNNNEESVNEVLSAFAKFWEIDRQKLTELIGERDVYGKVQYQNFRQ